MTIPSPIVAPSDALEASDRLVLLALYAEAQEQLDAAPFLRPVEVLITQSAIAERMGLHRSTVARALPRLKRLGLIEGWEVTVG